MPGDTIAGYLLEELVGAGGMGMVYRAHDGWARRAVALKLIAPYLARDDTFRERFAAEARIAVTLEHPNILPVFRAGEENGLLFMAMRFVPGGVSLRREIDRVGRLPYGRAARILSQVAGALDAVHRRNLVHRDVSPANVLLSYAAGDEHAYLSDFGLSLPVTATGEGSSAGVEGTLSYLSPDQILGQALDARSDVYALGCLLYHALSGAPPFADEDPAAVLDAHLHISPTPISGLVPGLPAGIDAVLARALAKAPDQREPSAGDFARLVRELRHDILLAHGPDGAVAAAEIADRLVAAGIDAAIASPNDDIGEAIGSAAACAVLVGGAGLQGWARPVLMAIRDRIADDPAFRPLAGLLPGAPEPHAAGLAFMNTWAWVDLRGGVARDESIRLLAWEVTGGRRPGGSSAAGQARNPYRGLESFREQDSISTWGASTTSPASSRCCVTVVSSRCLGHPGLARVP